MYKMTIISTGDEEIFNNYGELVFAVLDCYNGIDDWDLLANILRQLVIFKEYGIPFYTEIEDGLCIEKIAE